MQPLIDPGILHTQQADTGHDRPMGLCFEVPPSKVSVCKFQIAQQPRA